MTRITAMREPSDELREQREQGLLRELTSYQSSPLPELVSPTGETLINFSSNDYLGFSQHPALKAAANSATNLHGTGATASRLVCGTFDYHRHLEKKISSLKETEDALVFANGYTTALGTITALLGKDDVIILDKLSHACLIDAARLSGATIRVFPHNNLERLEHLLKKTREKSPPHTRIIVATESVFSMDGDLAPLPEIVALKNQYGALLLLDEAHALGVLGTNGLGLAEQLGLQKDIDLQMGTLGKAAGAAGGYLAASQIFIDLLINKARSFIYSTAPPPAQIASAAAAFDLLTSAEGRTRRKQLQTHISHLQQTLDMARSPHKDELAPTPIFPIILGTNRLAMSTAQKLRQRGYLVPAIRFPTVPRNTARLRITLSASHKKEHLDQFACILEELLSAEHEVL